MGKFFGRTKVGKLEAWVREFLSREEVGEVIPISDFIDFCNSKEEGKSNETAAIDTFRALVDLGFLKRNWKGYYKYIKNIDGLNSKTFKRYYNIKKDPGRYGPVKREKSVKDDVSQLTLLGSGKVDYKYEEPVKDILETFPNKYPGSDYVVEFECPEFTSLCPKTGQPDFAFIRIRYTPNKECIESKSLKLYLFAYRQYGSFMETITNKILEDLVETCSPKWMEVVGTFNARGGIKITVTATYHEIS